MKPGRVIKIRVNPRDCMTAVDIVSQTGDMPRGISFAQVVSVAMSTAFNTLREHDIVPKREGFEYSQMMEPFKDQPHLDRARKLAITKAFELAAPQHAPLPLPATPAAPVTTDKVRELKMAKWHALQFKKEQDPTNFTPAEERERLDLYMELYPDPEEIKAILAARHKAIDKLT